MLIFGTAVVVVVAVEYFGKDGTGFVGERGLVVYLFLCPIFVVVRCDRRV